MMKFKGAVNFVHIFAKCNQNKLFEKVDCHSGTLSWAKYTTERITRNWTKWRVPETSSGSRITTIFSSELCTVTKRIPLMSQFLFMLIALVFRRTSYPPKRWRVSRPHVLLPLRVFVCRWDHVYGVHENSIFLWLACTNDGAGFANLRIAVTSMTRNANGLHVKWW